jgi:uncharacterized membrane protein YuzA (DUF378 family)
MIKSNPVLPWVIAFLLLNLIVRGTGGHNELSRYATMRAMAEQGTFVIDKYAHWTDDWSISPEGKKYSNKAPGPMLLGFPFYFVIDSIFKESSTVPLSATPNRILPIIMQVLPFSLVVLFISYQMMLMNVPLGGVHFTAIALLFGNTSSIFMNTYFGHGMAAMFSVLLLLSVYKEKYKHVGLFFGFLLLCEYAAAVMFPLLILTLVLQSKNIRSWLKDLVLGGLIPGALWCWYHISTFGSPFKTAIQYENPMFLENHLIEKLIFGMFDSPDPSVIWALLFGSARGLLFTQPWILALILLLPISIILNKKSYAKNDILISFYGIASLIILILMNSSFNGWHGGATSGPRYLAIALAPLSLVVGICWRHFNKPLKNFLYTGLYVALVSRAFIYATTILAPVEPLFPFQWNFLITEGPKYFIRLGLFFAIFLISFYSVILLERRGRLK